MKFAEPIGSKIELNDFSFLRLMDSLYKWDLMPGERTLSLELSAEYGTRKILSKWEEFQELFPGKSIYAFTPWFTRLHTGDNNVI